MHGIVANIVDIVVHDIVYYRLIGEGNHIFVVYKKCHPPKSEHLPMPMFVEQICEFLFSFFYET